MNGCWNKKKQNVETINIKVKHERVMDREVSTQ
jgi:hypothetical protein